MKRLLVAVVGAVVVLSLSARMARAHCEVPCGIYDDELRFEQMLEDQTTIAKAIAQINDLAAKVDALSQNQLVRWVDTKEEHATKIQHIVAQYFLTQRIKPGNDAESHKAYVANLIAAHRVLQTAMKCKQTVDAENAAVLKKAVLDLYRVYEGKEPAFHE
ncbi:MAG TPA: superoxide dismutase [Ni] [Thermoguttaceae bacterium]|nr:superoxide dismutase [Ni] [Thermoguttaceae bacterium]